MADDKLSKTVRIDLMPGGEVSPTAMGRNDQLARANWSTRQRQAVVAAAATHSRYEELLESVYDAAVISAPSGKIIEVNGRAVEFLGYTRPQLCEMSMVDLIDGADEAIMRSISDTLLNERFALLQAFCRRNDGTLFPAEIAVNRLSMDNVRLGFFIRDVTVRYQTEEMLRTEHKALQTCASGIAITDTGGTLQYVNPALCSMLGREEEDLQGQDIREMLGSPADVGSLIDSSLGSDESWMIELDIDNGSGEPVYVQVSATCSRGSDDAARGIVFSVADITVHRKDEEESLAHHVEMEERVRARTMDLLQMTDRLQERVAELEAEVQQYKGLKRE